MITDTVTRTEVAAATGRSHDYLSSLLKPLPFMLKEDTGQVRHYPIGGVLIALRRRGAPDANIIHLIDKVA